MPLLVEFNSLVWTQMHPRANFEGNLGYIPSFLNGQSELPAAQQITANYPFGGWMPFKGFTFNKDDGTLRYPSDPPMPPLWQTMLPKTGEIVTIYEHAWVQIMQKDGTWEVARLD